MIKILISLLIFSTIVLSANKKSKIRHLQDDLASIRTKTTNLVGQIRSVEKTLGKKNNLYLNKVQKARELQLKANQISKSLKDNLMLINEQESIFTKVRRHLVLEVIDEDDENAYANFIALQTALKEKKKQLDKLKEENEKISLIFSSVQRDLQSSLDEEESLQVLILELEEKKSLLSQNYISSVEIQNSKQEEFDRLKINLNAKKKVYKKKIAKGKNNLNIKVISPIAKYNSFKEKDKVVTFEYESIEPVRAVASGKVEYAKELSSYGKVIIIDHGNQVRSIVLGDISVKTEKGLIVKQGELIGYTKTEPGMKKSLHFELRKNNKVQKALQALNLTTNDIKKI